MSNQLMATIPMKRVEEVERAAFASWPGLEVTELDGWHMRFANGVTRRANSVWPNGAANDLPLESKLEIVEGFYRLRNLPARYQICPAVNPRNLDEILATRGYQAHAPTKVQTIELSQLLHPAAENAFEVVISSTPTPVWWNCYAEAEEIEAGSLAGRKAICEQIASPTSYAMVMHQNQALAVGSATIVKDWVGFFNVATLPEYRRQGAAAILMSVLARRAAAHGVKFGYLQVTAANTAALRLYEKLGFQNGYEYHYRELP